MATHVEYPVRVEARLDDPSRWLWLVKWFLAIPHYIVLAFLWIAFFIVSFIAFFAILFTGKYPRSLFDFNAGVLRWTWRVQYYSYGALATDKYPPFTLQEVPDYPVHLTIDYPEKLSRGLVLVKWWLLAIPHYLIVGILVGGTWVAFDGGEWEGAAFGLIGLLAFIAAVILLFTGRYPRGLYDFVLGLNRWVIRVAAYAGLMTDAYPPFRLDTGGSEPGSTMAVGSAATEGAVGGTTSRGWTAGPILALIFGILVGMIGLGFAGAGGVGLWANTQREGGFVTTPETMLGSGGYAITSDDIDINAEGPDWAMPDWILGDARVRVMAGQNDLFVGAGPSDKVTAYLAGVSHSTVDDPWGDDRHDIPATSGGAPSGPPGDQNFWIASSEGSGTQSITWPVTSGTWSIVVMNADGSDKLMFETDIGAEFPALGAFATGLLIAGALMLLIGVILVVGAVTRASRKDPTPPETATS
jgi:Domain of unknown function (DUF4389)